jgi:hypothetical protein
VRRFGEQRLRPHIADWFEAGEVPVRELAADLGKLGVLGMHLKGYGCGGSTATAYGLVCQELEAIDSGLRSLVSVQGSPATFAIYRWASEEQRNQWLPASHRCFRVVSFVGYRGFLRCCQVLPSSQAGAAGWAPQRLRAEDGFSDESSLRWCVHAWRPRGIRMVSTMNCARSTGVVP